jgi:hypothetical protein
VSGSDTNLIPSTSKDSSFSRCSSRAIPKIGPPQPKLLIINLTADLFFLFKSDIKDSLVVISMFKFITLPPLPIRGISIFNLLYSLISYMSIKNIYKS